MANTHGLQASEVLCALYHRAQPVGYGMLQYKSGGLSLEEAETLILQHNGAFDYLFGRLMKVSISSSGGVDDWGFDRFYGQGACQNAIDDYYTTPTEGRKKFHT